MLAGTRRVQGLITQVLAGGSTHHMSTCSFVTDKNAHVHIKQDSEPKMNVLVTAWKAVDSSLRDQNAIASTLSLVHNLQSMANISCQVKISYLTPIS